MYLTWLNKAGTDGAFLAQIPTGYGKTVIILFLGCLIRFKHPDFYVLAVVTNDYLKNVM